MLITDVPSAITGLAAGSQVMVGYSEKFAAQFILKSMKPANKGALINLEGIDNETKVAALKEKALFADERYILRKKAAYFEDELCGCKVMTDKERELGVIAEVWEMPANDVWLISAEEYTLPFPAVDAFVISVSKDEKLIRVRDFPGLDDLKEMRK